MAETAWVDGKWHMDVGSPAYVEYLREHPDAEVVPDAAEGETKPKAKRAKKTDAAEGETKPKAKRAKKTDAAEGETLD